MVNKANKLGNCTQQTFQEVSLITHFLHSQPPTTYFSFVDSQKKKKLFFCHLILTKPFILFFLSQISVSLAPHSLFFLFFLLYSSTCSSNFFFFHLPKNSSSHLMLSFIFFSPPVISFVSSHSFFFFFFEIINLHSN